MNKTTVVHCKKHEYDQLVDRTTILGNPFRIGIDGTREECIAKYELYARERMKHDLVFAQAIWKCRGKRIACWCSPLACHGEVIARIADQDTEEFMGE